MIKITLNISLLTHLFLITSCSTEPFSPEMRTNATVRIAKEMTNGPHKIGNIEFKKPKGNEWKVKTLNKNGVFYLNRLSRSHSIVASGTRIFPPKTNHSTPQEFLDYTIPALNYGHKKQGKILHRYYKLDDEFGRFCIKSDVVLKQTGKLVLHEFIILYLSAIEYTCRHPNFKNEVYQFSYSERSQEKTDFKKLEKMAHQYFSQIRFLSN